MNRTLLQSIPAVALILFAGGCQTTEPPAPAALPAAQALDARLGEQSKAPGVIGAVLRNGVATEVFAWGTGDCAGGGAVDVNAAYEVGSISKHMTAVALLRLWEKGRVDLDAPVGDYLDDIPKAWQHVTLRQLATHTSGVPDYEEAGGYGVYETKPTHAQVYAIVADRPLDFEPGTRWSYSNTGYFLLSLVVEHASGERFGDYLRTQLFEPLGMRHTFMGGYAPVGVRLAPGCKPAEVEGGARVPVKPIDESSTYGAGGVSTTLQDWALWDDALFEGRLLSPQAMEVLLTPQRLLDGSNSGYGFGLFPDEYRGGGRIRHSGQTQGFSAFYEHFPDQDVSVVTFANMYGSDIMPVSQALVFHAIPQLSYDNLVVPTDPDPVRTQANRRALRQALLNEQPGDLLSDDMRKVATDAKFAETREEMRVYAEHSDEFVYLRSDATDGESERHIFKLTLDGDTTYIAFIWHGGLVVGMQRMDE
jgi:CubicO group peptidase (beta-lactamase class C family)